MEDKVNKHEQSNKNSWIWIFNVVSTVYRVFNYIPSKNIF